MARGVYASKLTLARTRQATDRKIGNSTRDPFDRFRDAFLSQILRQDDHPVYRPGDLALVAEDVAGWADVLEIDLYPVIDDTEAGAAAKKVFGT